MNIYRACLASIAITLGAGLAHAADPVVGPFPNAIPVEALLAPLDFIGPRLSPAGKHLAFLTELGTGKQGIALMDLATGRTEALVGLPNHDVSYFFWKGDDLIVFGIESIIWGWETICTVSISTRNVETISPSLTPDKRLAVKNNFVWLASSLPLSSDKILVRGLIDKDRDDYVYQVLDVHTKEISTVDTNEPLMPTVAAIPDPNGNVLARFRSGKGKHLFEVRPVATSEFILVTERAWTDPSWKAFGLDTEKNALFVVVEGDGYKETLHTLALATGELGSPLLELEREEVVAAFRSEDLKRFEGVMIEGEKSRMHWFDPARARLQAQIDASMPATFNAEADSTTDGKVMLFLSTSDIEPGVFYILDRRVPRLMPLGNPRSQIDRSLLCPMQPVKFAARDGLELHGYVTPPKGRDNRPAPLVVVAHDGPFDTRDTWEYSPTVQFFASRGYAVLQVNFRGSSGYGSAFERAGWQEVGGKMQDDIAAGVAWAVQSGIADPARVTIFGEGYGGYAALMGLVTHPGLYRCAINFSGVLDLNTEVGYAWWRTKHSREYLEARFDSGRDVLKARSPMNLTDRLSAPTLHLYHAAGDHYKKETWKKFSDRLKKAKAPYESMVVDDIRPYGKARDVRIALFKRTEEFLAKHMPPDE